MTSTYTPTLIEKLLGRNYKWWYLILFNVKSQRAYIGDTIFWTLYSFVYTFGMFAVWWLTTKDNPNFSTSDILTYLYFGSLIGSLTNNWSNRALGWDNQEGKLTQYLLYPTSYFSYQYVIYIGRQAMANFPVQIFSLLLLLPILGQYIILNLNQNLLAVVLLVPIIYSINLFLNFTFGCITFWIVEIEGANQFYGYFRDFLKGAVIPLSLISPFIPFVQFTPFALTLHHPMQIYLGEYNSLDILLVFLGGIFWCVILYFFANFIFKIGLKRNESVGL